VGIGRYSAGAAAPVTNANDGRLPAHAGVAGRRGHFLRHQHHPSDAGRLHPEPTLYPASFGGLSQALSFNWERTVWIPAIGILVHFLGDLPPDFIKDRQDGYPYIDISKNAMEPEFDLNVQRVRAQLAWLKEALGDGRKFLFGDTLTLGSATRYCRDGHSRR
jgi:hypothetical protein